MEILRPFTVHKVAGADPERFRIDYKYPEHYSGVRSASELEIVGMSEVLSLLG